MTNWFSRRAFLGLLAAFGWGCRPSEQQPAESRLSEAAAAPDSGASRRKTEQAPQASPEQSAGTPDDSPAESADEGRPSPLPTGWGHLRGRFVYDGEPPVRKLCQIPADHKDRAYCAQFKLREEKIVVDPATKGLANVIVWLVGSSRNRPAVHESYAATEKAEVKLDSTQCRVDPHISLLRTTQTLVLRNTDPISDGLKIDSLKNKPLNVMIPIQGELLYSFRKPERLPVPVHCPVHGWESGWLLVQDHPYMAVSATDGTFEIKNLPAGKWTFQFWQEESGYIHEVKRDGQQETWSRGRLEIDVKEGENDLGKIVLAPALFKKK